MRKQVHALYSGHVQGVGFRFTAENIAAGLGVTGWVKNLADGRVEVVAEAEEEALNSFLAELSGHFSRWIKDTELDWQPAGGKFKEFGINF